MFLFARKEPKVYWLRRVCLGRALSAYLRRGHISRGPPGRYLCRSFWSCPPTERTAWGWLTHDTGSPDSAQTQLQDFPSELRSSHAPCLSLSARLSVLIPKEYVSPFVAWQGGPGAERCGCAWGWLGAKCPLRTLRSPGEQGHMPLTVPAWPGGFWKGAGRGAQGVGQAWAWPWGWWTQHIHPDGVSDLDCESEPQWDGEEGPRGRNAA